MTTESELVEQWMPLALSYAMRAGAKLVPLDDRVSAAYEGLVKGVQKYLSLENPPYQIGTYLRYRILHALRDERLRCMKHNKFDLIDWPADTWVGSEAGPSGKLSSVSYLLAREEPDQDYSWLVTECSAKERELADLLAEGLTEADVARKLGISREAVRQRKMTLRSKIESALDRDRGGGQ